MTLLDIKNDPMCHVLESIYAVRRISSCVAFEDAIDGFLNTTVYGNGKFTFDTTYTRDRMQKDWKGFLSGAWWVINGKKK